MKNGKWQIIILVCTLGLLFSCSPGGGGKNKNSNLKTEKGTTPKEKVPTSQSQTNSNTNTNQNIRQSQAIYYDGKHMSSEEFTQQVESRFLPFSKDRAQNLLNNLNPSLFDKEDPSTWKHNPDIRWLLTTQLTTLEGTDVIGMEDTDTRTTIGQYLLIADYLQKMDDLSWIHPSDLEWNADVKYHNGRYSSEYFTIQDKIRELDRNRPVPIPSPTVTAYLFRGNQVTSRLNFIVIKWRGIEADFDDAGGFLANKAAWGRIIHDSYDVEVKIDNGNWIKLSTLARHNLNFDRNDLQEWYRAWDWDSKTNYTGQRMLLRCRYSDIQRSTEYRANDLPSTSPWTVIELTKAYDPAVGQDIFDNGPDNYSSVPFSNLLP